MGMKVFVKLLRPHFTSAVICNYTIITHLHAKRIDKRRAEEDIVDPKREIGESICMPKCEKPLLDYEVVAAESDSDIYEDLEDYDETKDPYLMAMLNDDNVLKYIKMYHHYEVLDTHAAFPIFIDLYDLESRDIDMDCFACFIEVCYNKYTLEIYDHPGDPRICGYFHEKGEEIPEIFRQVAVYAFNWYHENHPEGKTKQLKEVNRMSCSPDCYPFFHMTFTVVNELTNEEVTLQAQVIQFMIGDLQLGMLRDASHDRVLAAIHFKEAPTGDTHDVLKRQLKDIWEKVVK